MTERFGLHLDLFDCLALAGAVLIALGLLLFHPALCLVWIGLLLLTPAIFGARKWASRNSKKKPLPGSTDAD